MIKTPVKLSFPVVLLGSEGKLSNLRGNLSSVRGIPSEMSLESVSLKDSPNTLIWWQSRISHHFGSVIDLMHLYSCHE